MIMSKKYLLLFIPLFVLSGCALSNPKISKIQIKNEANEVSEDERNYFGSYLGEITIANPPSSQAYELEITGYQEFASPVYETYPVYETRVKIEPDKTNYTFLIPNKSSVDLDMGKEFSYDECKNLIIKAKLCLIKNNICFGEPLDKTTYLHMRSCGE